MKINTYVKLTTTLYLEGPETFRTTTKDNNAFNFEVDQISWSGGDYVTLRGPGISRTGLRLTVFRTDYRKFTELNSAHQDALITDRLDAIRGLTKELEDHR